MCGIAGIISANSIKEAEQVLQPMAAALAHRGPNGEGFWTNAAQTVALAHRRLAIIELGPAGKQPMHYTNRYTITYNGELYNYIELRQQLQQKGYQFTTQTDIEVILAAYDCWQQNCLQYFDGMFAFALWDEQEQQLFAARDRFGEKPFYHWWNAAAQQWYFASELKALWATGAPKQWQGTALLNFIILGMGQNPADSSTTFYKDLYSLPPASYLLIQPGKSIPAPIQYWQLATQIHFTGSMEDAADELRQLLATSIKRRLRSDVEVGTSLSGGLDSASIAALIGEQGKALHSFSAVFPGFEKDEGDSIALLAGQLGLQSYTTTPVVEQLITNWEKLCYQQEQPFGSASIFAQYKVFALAAQQGITVLLDGQGADEILAGYTKYWHWHLQALWRSNKAQWTAEKKACLQTGQPLEWSLRNHAAALWPVTASKALQKKAYKQQVSNSLLSQDFLQTYRNKATLEKPVVRELNDVLAWDTTRQGLEELLRYADHNSMAHGREVRLPFLNHELVQFVFSLPAAYKMHKGFTKAVLRRAVKEMVPAAIVNNPVKTGFEPPQYQWMQDATLQEYIHEACKKWVQQGVLHPAVLVQKITPAAAHSAGNFYWRLLAAAGTVL